MTNLYLKGKRVISQLITDVIIPISVLEGEQRLRLLKFLKDFGGSSLIKWEKEILPSLNFNSDNHLEFRLSHFHTLFKDAERSLISTGQGYSRATCCAATHPFASYYIFKRTSFMEGLA
jgi:hypothetical protein